MEVLADYGPQAAEEKGKERERERERERELWGHSTRAELLPGKDDTLLTIINGIHPLLSLC
jgi:hypothetical protein